MYQVVVFHALGWVEYSTEEVECLQTGNQTADTAICALPGSWYVKHPPHAGAQRIYLALLNAAY